MRSAQARADCTERSKEAGKQGGTCTQGARDSPPSPVPRPALPLSDSFTAASTTRPTGKAMCPNGGNSPGRGHTRRCPRGDGLLPGTYLETKLFGAEGRGRVKKRACSRLAVLTINHALDGLSRMLPTGCAEWGWYTLPSLAVSDLSRCLRSPERFRRGITPRALAYSDRTPLPLPSPYGTPTSLEQSSGQGWLAGQKQALARFGLVRPLAAASVESAP
jgi:hypothetical protein